MTEEILECVEVDARNADASVIWLHGLGADGNDFPPIVPELRLPKSSAVRFVFPHAPRIPVTINGGMMMRAWYDILGMDFDRRHDEAGIEASRAHVTRLIERELKRGVAAERIVLAGFSQGGAIALHTGLREKRRLAGIVALSTYLVCEDRFGDERSKHNQATPIFQAHGQFDPMVAFERGTRARDTLRGLEYDVEWHEYPMVHQVCIEEIEALGVFLRKVLKLGD